jgi:hypothetical protein
MTLLATYEHTLKEIEMLRDYNQLLRKEQ